jgi:YD repeat-containing protein
MSSDSESGNTRDPYRTVTTYVYDANARLTSQASEGVETRTTHYDSYGRVIDPAAPPLPEPSEPPPELEPIQRLFAHTFEFRLSSSEEKLEVRELPPVPPCDRIVVTTDRVRTMVSRGRESPAASTVIGSIEIQTEVRPKTANGPATLVCVAAVRDFGPDDLVVIQVEVTVSWVLCKDRQ